MRVPMPDEVLENPESTDSRVPSWKAKAVWLLIRRAVGPETPRWMIIRMVASQVGLDPTSVHRYVSGRLATTPAKLVEALQLLLEEVQAGNPIGVSHPREPQQRLVPRTHAVAAIDALPSSVNVASMIGIGVAVEAFGMGNLHPAQDQFSPLDQGMNIITDANMNHGGNILRSSGSTKSFRPTSRFRPLSLRLRMRPRLESLCMSILFSRGRPYAFLIRRAEISTPD